VPLSEARRKSWRQAKMRVVSKEENNSDKFTSQIVFGSFLLFDLEADLIETSV
jgi:hypothetical protein